MDGRVTVIGIRMPPKGWISIGLPNPLVARVDEHLETDGVRRSRAELVRTAVEDWLARNQKVVHPTVVI